MKRRLSIIALVVLVGLAALYLYRDGHFHAELRAEAHPAKLHAAIETQLIAPAEEAP